MMNNDPTRLEFLPNELLVEVFDYLNAREIFRAFGSLNTRFTSLLQSLRDLFVTLTTSNVHEIIYADVDPQWIRTMTLHRAVDINLRKYSNLRRMKFLSPTLRQLDNFESYQFSTSRTSFHVF